MKTLPFSAVSALLFLAGFSSAQAELPDGLVMDHGFTFFEVEHEVDHEDGSPVDLGWKLRTRLRMIGSAPEHSAFRTVIRDGREVLAEKRTEAYQQAGRAAPDASPTNPTPIPQLWLRGGVQDEMPPVRRTGTFELDVHYIAGDTDEEHLAHTYTIDVGKAERVRGSSTAPQADTPLYFVSRHQEALSTLLTRTVGYWEPRQGYGVQMGPSIAGQYTLIWNASPKEEHWSGPTNDTRTAAWLRCTVDGEPLTWGNPENPQFENMKASLDNTRTKEVQNVHVVQTDRNSPDYRRGNPYREVLHWRRYATELPLVNRHRPSEDGFFTVETATAEHPGDWECDFVDNGEVLRVFRWTVNEDGSLKPHEEQEQGLTLAPATILVETEIPDGGASFDGRLVPEAVQDGGFYGWEWKSGDMKKLARSVPEVGEPWPKLSAATFIDGAEEGAPAQPSAREDQAAAAQDEPPQRDERETPADRPSPAQPTADARLVRDDPERAARQGGGHLLLRILLGVVLLALGFVLAGDALRRMIAPLSAVVDALTPRAGAIGLAAIVLAIIDVLADLAILRPLVGDGLPQIAALAGGMIAAKGLLVRRAASFETRAAALEGQASLIGWACLILGLLHLLVGDRPFV